MLVFGVSYVVLLTSILDFADPDRRILVRIAVCFGLAFAVSIGINYFLQISAVRLGILKGQTQGLEQFIQSNPISGVAAINMLGWTVFFALSSLFVAPVFTGGRLEKVIRSAFLVNGIICLLGGVGYVFDLAILIFFCMYLGMGAAVLVAVIPLCIMFRRMLARH